MFAINVATSVLDATSRPRFFRRTKNMATENGLFSCPPAGTLGHVLTNVLLVTFVWCGLYAVTDAESGVMMPGGSGFALLALLVLCRLAGAVVGLARLPGLLGMLVMGLAIKNVPALVRRVNIDSRSLFVPIVRHKSALYGTCV
jgi:hypothetical protein